MTRRTALLVPLSSIAFAKRWETAEFPNWSQDYIDRVVTDSPWSKPWRGTAEVVFPQKMVSSFSQIGIGLPSPVPGIGWPGGSRTGRTPGRLPAPDSSGLSVLRVGTDLIIRWASALPVRRALALQEFGKNGLDHPKALALLQSDVPEFVIHVAGIPRVIVGDSTDAMQKQLRETARLLIPGRRPLTPDVEIPSYGVQLTASLRFPRVENLSADAGDVTFTSSLGSLRIEEKFKLRAMVYEGRLEL